MIQNTSRNFVTKDDLNLSYLVFGSGRHIYLCFHGHGKTSEDFEFLADPSRKIIAVDLFLHGNSVLGNNRIEKNPITKVDVADLIQKVLVAEGVDRFSLLAYSQGGRFAFAVLQVFFDKIDYASLWAVDGLNDQNVYSWSQRRSGVRKLFNYWSHKPKMVNNVGKTLLKVKLLNPKMYQLLNFYTKDKKTFRRSFKAWSAFRKLRTDELFLRNNLKKSSITFQVVIGRFDQIITKKSATSFLSRIGKEGSLVLIDSGHDFFKPEIKKNLLLLVEQHKLM